MISKSIDTKVLLDAAVEAAIKAGEVLKDGFGTSFSVSIKSGAHDLVTEYDKAAEKAVISRLKKQFPDHAFLSEEAGLSEHGGESVRWIIDPIDGTLNFCHSIPYFAVSIGAEHDGRLLCGVVFNPVTDELFFARKGGGAWLNDKKLQVSRTEGLKKAVLAIGFPFNTEADPGHCISRFARVAGEGAQLLRMGSTAMNLAYVAAGRFDGFWETDFFPWDVAGGALLVMEAGGVVTNIDGSPLDMNTRGIVAAGPSLHEEIVAVLAEQQDGQG